MAHRAAHELTGAGAGPRISGVVGGRWTGDLIECAVNLGAIAAGAPTRFLLATSEYGRSLGLTCQIVDDLLDASDPAKADEPPTPPLSPGVPKELAEALSSVHDAMDYLGIPQPPDPLAPEKASALALLRALAEDQLSRIF